MTVVEKEFYLELRKINTNLELLLKLFKQAMPSGDRLQVNQVSE